MRRLIARLLPIVALAACDNKEELGCTTIAMVSVTVNVRDAEGAPVPNARVRHVVAEGEFGCDQISDTTWLCSYETAGDIPIIVTAEGYVDFRETVTVEADECHVISQTLDVVLAPVPA